MAVNLSRLYNADSLYEQLISQVIASEAAPQRKLRTQQSDQRIYKAALTDFDSSVSKLHTLAKRFKDPLRAPFQSLSATTSEGAGFSASAGSGAAAGEHTLTVDRLARADARVSKQVQASGSTLVDLFTTASTVGPRSFTIHIDQGTDPAVALDVTYEPPSGATDEEILTGIASAINTAAADARSGGLLKSGTGASASVVRETSDTARLSLQSLATGYGNRLTFSDPDGVLAGLEVNNTAVRSGSGGGAVHAVGTSATDSALTASFQLDGLTLYRDSNTVSDALTGVTLTLSASGGAEGRLTIGANTSEMRTEVESFVSAYNEVLSFINRRTAVDGSSQSRGTFAGDSTLTSLRSSMRTDLAQAFTGSALGSLKDIGIDTDRDGTLRIANSTKLDDALAANTAAFGAVFSGTNGIAERLANRLEPVTGFDGILANRKKTADARIKRLDTEILRWDTRLASREDSLRSQFAQLQAVAQRAQNQQSSFQSYLISYS
jgi:flagellar hook-associated protein 2